MATNGRSRIGVLVVRNETTLFADVLARALRAEPSVRLLSPPLVYEAALDFCRHKRPDVVLIETTATPPGRIRGLVTSIAAVCGEAPAILLADQVVEDPFFVAGVEAGAFAILDGSARVEQVVDAVRAAAVRERSIDRDRLMEAVQTTARSRERKRQHLQRIGGLTEREREVLGCLVEGLRNSDIARRYSISPRTVEKHVQSILRKLAVSSRLGAAALASKMSETAYEGVGGTA